MDNIILERKISTLSADDNKNCNFSKISKTLLLVEEIQ